MRGMHKWQTWFQNKHCVIRTEIFAQYCGTSYCRCSPIVYFSLRISNAVRLFMREWGAEHMPFKYPGHWPFWNGVIHSLKSHLQYHKRWISAKSTSCRTYAFLHCVYSPFVSKTSWRHRLNIVQESSGFCSDRPMAFGLAFSWLPFAVRNDMTCPTDAT